MAENKSILATSPLRTMTIILEDCTSEIKRLLNKAIFQNMPYDIYLKEADKVIIEQTEELDDNEFRADTRRILRRFARTEYDKLKSRLTGLMVGFSFVALAAVKKIYNSESASDKEVAFRVLQTIEPQFQNYQVTFRPGIGAPYRWGVPLNQYMKTYMRKVETVTRMLASDTPREEKEGKSSISLRLKAELYVRQQWHEDMMRDLDERNIDLVWISSHENCSSRCQFYQGRLYSRKGYTGQINGVNYLPLSVATNRYTTTKAGTRYLNGTITGFGCRHYLIPYEDGVIPLKFTDERVEQARRIEQEQRALERRVYKLRESYYASAGNDAVKARQFYNQAVTARKDYFKFCREHNIAAEPSRLKVMPF